MISNPATSISVPVASLSDLAKSISVPVRPISNLATPTSYHASFTSDWPGLQTFDAKTLRNRNDG